MGPGTPGGVGQAAVRPSPCCPLGSVLASHFSPLDPSSSPWPVLEPSSVGHLPSQRPLSSLSLKKAPCPAATSTVLSLL